MIETMEITETKTIRLVASEGSYLTQKSVDADNFRTFSKALVLDNADDANLYEEWTEKQVQEWNGDVTEQVVEKEDYE